MPTVTVAPSMPSPVTASTTSNVNDAADERSIVVRFAFPFSSISTNPVTVFFMMFIFPFLLLYSYSALTVTVPASIFGTPVTIASPLLLVVPVYSFPLPSMIVTVAFCKTRFFLPVVTLIFTSCVVTCAIAPMGSSSSTMRKHPMATTILLFIVLNFSMYLISATFSPCSIPTICTLPAKTFL